MIPLSRPLIVLDTETTGLNPKVDRIVEISFLVIKPDNSQTPFTALIDPGCPIPPEATAINHITDAMVKDQRTFSSFAEKLAKGLTDVDIAGKRVSFDLAFLEEEFKRVDIAWTHTGSIIDVDRLWQVLEPRSLKDAVRHFLGREHDGAHRAEADVAATWAVIQEQLRRLTPCPGTVAELHKFLNPVPKGAVDGSGKIVWSNGVAVLGPWSKKHGGKPLVSVDKGYLQWILDNDFPTSTKAVIRDALRGVYPKPEAKR